MSYVHPPASAVVASWQGEDVYVHPAAGAVTAQFGLTGQVSYTATPLPSSVFGDPREGILQASTVPESQFGTPFGQSLLRTSRVSRGALFGTPLALFVSDGAGNGLDADFSITGFSVEQPLEEALSVSVTAKPTCPSGRAKALGPRRAERNCRR